MLKSIPDNLIRKNKSGAILFESRMGVPGSGQSSEESKRQEWVSESLFLT